MLVSCWIVSLRCRYIRGDGPLRRLGFIMKLVHVGAARRTNAMLASVVGLVRFEAGEELAL